MFAAALPSALAASEAMRRMLAAEDLLIRPAVAIAAVSGQNTGKDAGRTDPAELTSRFAGRTFQATVLEKLADGSANVLIEGETFQVAAHLPETARSVMLRFAPTGTVVAPAAPGAATSTGVTVGALAHALSDVARTAAAPLALGAVNADPARPREFAAALSNLVRDSGMFYEAHLARWTQGHYPIDLLRREPQAVLPAVPPPAGADSRAVMETDVGAPASKAVVAGNAGPAPLAESLQPVLREQLQLLENRCLAIAIQPWPGQTAFLEIAEESADDGAPQALAPEASWVSRLRLDLPHLGKVDAELTLGGNRLSVVIHASGEATANLARDTGALAQAMSDAGIALAGCRIVEHATS